MATKLFISYRSLDSAKVDSIVSRLNSLKSPDGLKLYEIWQDKLSIIVGQDWWKAIVNGINECDAFIFMISHESVSNINCQAELAYARKRNRPIIPLVLEDEYGYNTITGKNDISFWEDIPSELNNSRFQFLFFEGVASIQQLEKSIDLLVKEDFPDMPAPEPLDPRTINVSEDSYQIYDRANDFAWRLEFATAEKLFQKLVDWKDELFSHEALEWIILVREYEKILRLHQHKNTRFKVPTLLSDYLKKFPKPFIELFDPKNLKDYYSSQIKTELLFKPSLSNIMPQPFEWCYIPRNFVSYSQDWDDYYACDTSQVLEPYYISKFPITLHQFLEFVIARNGYSQKEWWDENRQPSKYKYCDYNIYGDVVDGGKFFSMDRYLKFRDKLAHAKATLEEMNQWLIPATVTRFEAIAFCRWLSELSSSFIFVPSEAHWVLAAQGTSRNKYPWGNEFDAHYCNSALSGYGQVTPVTTFPYGASEFGLIDCVGNIPEWCVLGSESKHDGFSFDYYDSGRFHNRGTNFADSETENFRCLYRGKSNAPMPEVIAGFRICTPATKASSLATSYH
ncbi:SUMF1/EgtB/PvdO family nonheme iron enzyme [Phototrophicus methaneseepsis]|uniref:SUMF1/EgtB/PvdO family nonheme iron enzyme n=1 Tax=Phototrophicus methaneseepsis TaxID=2710758 RepID=A0A7S8EAZ5_9CHLR|nr:SUMF1/EgtB/PvdO family nonheme iron enzyme [Phototrophicus methaneseepsis]QPC83647.1 SUMF1/EgtB/PvdO family nonheme iron enzyme [Phototrophicus methaneseepsis]